VRPWDIRIDPQSLAGNAISIATFLKCAPPLDVRRRLIENLHCTTMPIISDAKLTNVLDDVRT
jgi:hypothetical protein